MGIIAKLHADGQAYNILQAEQSIIRRRDGTGRPTSRPFHTGLIAVIEPTKDTYFFEKAIHPTQQIQEIILEYINNMPDGRTRRIRFVDCYVTYDRTDFKANGRESLTETLIITAAGIEDSHSNGKYTTPRRKTAFLSDQIPVAVREEQEPEIIEEVKFIAKLERPDNYKGEFGFDWMRDNYDIICEDYEELKKEYTPITIEGEEYFVPWLSMFPNQKNVTLRLGLDIKEGTPTDQDVIKLPRKDGIRFEPEELKVSQANGTQITVHCDSSLTNDVKIELLDKEDQIVGKINIFKNANHNQLNFEITPVRILRSISKESDEETIENRIDNPQGFGEKNKGIEGDLQNLQEFLNTQSLNQALLQCKIGKVYDIVIDEEKWIKDDLIIEDRCVFKGNLLDKFNQEFKKQHADAFKNRGITVYMSPLNHSTDGGEEGAGGYGNLGDIDAKGLVVFQSNLWDKTTFVHEISHVAGLEHSFKEDDDIYNDKTTLDNHNTYIKQVDDYLNYMINNGYSKKEIADFWNTKKEDYSYVRSKLNVYYRNLHKFKQSSTDNFMDYYNTRQTFWKFQWKALQDDILKFYKS